VHETTTFLHVTLPNIHRFKKNFFNDGPLLTFLNLLINNPQHLEYVATLPCIIVNRLFPNINVSQGCVATYASSGGIFNNHFSANLPGNLLVKKLVNRLRYDRIIAVSLWSHFLAHLVEK